MNWFSNLLLSISNSQHLHYRFDIVFHWFRLVFFMFVLHFDIFEAKVVNGGGQNDRIIVTMSFKKVFVTLHSKISRSVNVQVSNWHTFKSHHIYLAQKVHGEAWKGARKQILQSSFGNNSIYLNGKMQILTEEKKSMRRRECAGKRNCMIIIQYLSDSIQRRWMK